MKVTLYTRDQKTRRYTKINKKRNYTPDTVYVLRYARKWETLKVGTMGEALIERSLKEADLLRTGGVVDAPKAERITVAVAAEKYLEYIQATRSHKTWLAYSLALRDFQQVCKKEFIDQISLDDLRAYEAAQFTAGKDARTVDNRLTNIGSWLHYNDIKISHHCKYVERRVKAYSDGQLTGLYAVSTPEENEVWSFFLGSGFREQESAHAHFTDIDWELKQIVPRCKAEHDNWVPKDKEERCVPIPDDLIDMLKARRRRMGGSDGLIFPNNEGNPEGHFLRMLQARAEAAGLGGTWGLHVFRKSFATRHYRNGVLPQTIQRWLGHSDLATTMRYLEDEDNNSPAIREKVNSSFTGIGLQRMEAPAQTM